MLIPPEIDPACDTGAPKTENHLPRETKSPMLQDASCPMPVCHTWACLKARDSLEWMKLLRREGKGWLVLRGLRSDPASL